MFNSCALHTLNETVMTIKGETVLQFALNPGKGDNGNRRARMGSLGLFALVCLLNLTYSRVRGKWWSFVASKEFEKSTAMDLHIYSSSAYSILCFVALFDVKVFKGRAHRMLGCVLVLLHVVMMVSVYAYFLCPGATRDALLPTKNEHMVQAWHYLRFGMGHTIIHTRALHPAITRNRKEHKKYMDGALRYLSGGLVLGRSLASIIAAIAGSMGSKSPGTIGQYLAISFGAVYEGHIFYKRFHMRGEIFDQHSVSALLSFLFVLWANRLFVGDQSIVVAWGVAAALYFTIALGTIFTSALPEVTRILLEFALCAAPWLVLGGMVFLPRMYRIAPLLLWAVPAMFSLKGTRSTLSRLFGLDRCHSVKIHIDEKPLSNERPCLYGMHPHGWFPLSTTCVMGKGYFRNTVGAANPVGVLYAMASWSYCLSGSIVSATRRSICSQLAKGKSVALFAGGVDEMLNTEPFAKQIRIRKAKAFLRLAMKEKVPVTPCFCFALNDEFSDLFGSSIHKQFYALTGFPLIPLLGNKHGIPFLSNAPKSRDIVIGKPLDPAKFDDVHAFANAYYDRLLNLFENEKRKHGFSDRELIVDESKMF